MSRDTSAVDRYRAALFTVGLAILENAEGRLRLEAFDRILSALGFEDEDQFRAAAKQELHQ